MATIPLPLNYTRASAFVLSLADTSAYLESLSYLIIEWSTPYTLPTFPSPRWVATLNHEILDITVE